MRRGTRRALVAKFPGEHVGAQTARQGVIARAANQAIVNGLGPLKAYHQFHLGGSYRASDHLTFNATVYNLLDKDFLEGSHYTTHTGATAWGSHYAQIGAGTVGTIQEGRRLWLSVNVDF